jgi:alkanesulfonate monooxygenase SsuD/methylene tetrahydromethanopterin reductase-like flavin-dependent oxidoreductase (luciferase family)
MRTALFADPGRSMDEAAERVRLAESLGYESVWTTQTTRREPLHVLNHYAHATSTIGLGTGVVTALSRHPIVTATEAATVDDISGGRLTLGLGVGHKLTIEGWHGLTLDDPVGRLREYTEIVRDLFTVGSSYREGVHYTTRYQFLGFTPRSDIRIVWAALGERMLRAAAELADGAVLWMCSPSHIRSTIRPILDEALAAAGRSPDSFDVIASVPVALTDDPAAARDVFRTFATPYVSLPFYRKEIAQAHPDALAAHDQHAEAGDMAAAKASLDDAFVDDYCGIGEEDAISAKVEEYRGAGVTLPAVGPISRHQGSRGADETLRAAAPR